jgi:uncharacterized protein YqkB
MPEINDQPAFPIPPRIDCLKKFEDADRPDEWEVHYETEGDGAEWSGMSLRDYFAAAALTGLIACPDIRFVSTREYAEAAYNYATRMIAERQKERPT